MKWHDPFGKCERVRHNPRKGKKWPMMPRQRMILHLYNLGLNTEEVCEFMNITAHTAYQHMKRICYKLGVHDRGSAIQKGI